MNTKESFKELIKEIKGSWYPDKEGVRTEEELLIDIGENGLEQFERGKSYQGMETSKIHKIFGEYIMGRGLIKWK